MSIIESGSIYLALALLAVSLLYQLWAGARRRGQYAEEGEAGAGPSGRLQPANLMRIGAAALIFVHLIALSVMRGFPAITAQYEALVLFGGLVLVVVQVAPRVRSIPALVGVVDLLAFLLLALSSSPLVPYAITPPMPALRSGWMVFHIVLAFLGEAFFTVAFGASILLLLSKSEQRRARLDRITYISIAYGYALFTLGALVFGAIWAYQAWGRYWGWDPKETWSLITWLVYSVYLHLRFVRKRSRKISSIASIVGYLAMMFTLFGVNWLYASVHSY